MAVLAAPPGHEIGRLLRLLEEAQAAGEVNSPDEALAFVRRHHRRKNKTGPHQECRPVTIA
jgi:hypothetical protein